uniref:SGNH hydrolase-type esterase domain-containing protein n=1 Tax=Amphiprion percula TaxID=161767 RepID=A0A3P8RS32_AMPPE
MARGKSQRRSQAAKKRMEVRRSLNFEPQEPPTSTRALFFFLGRGTGYRHAVQKWPTSSLTGRSHKLVIPAESPHKKFVLLIGDSHLRSFADGFVKMPEGSLSFGVQSTPGATAAELTTEVVHAALPRTPATVCLLAPSNNLTASRTIEHASADFGKLLAIVCNCVLQVVVVDFPPRLNIDVQLQQLFREEYHRVAARMGIVKHFSAVDYFPTGHLDLWSRDGVHLSDTGGMPILAQLLWHASYMVSLEYWFILLARQPPAPKPQAPPRSHQTSSLPRVVVSGPVTQPRLSANTFEWTVVSCGREVNESSMCLSCGDCLIKVLRAEKKLVIIVKGYLFCNTRCLSTYSISQQWSA